MPADRPTHHQTAYDVKYKQKPEYKASQRARAKARYWMIKRLGAKALRGMDVDHKKPLAAGGSNHPSNWRLRTSRANKADKSVFKKKGFDSYTN